jgi:predicted NAD/FAD-binding protein
VDVVIQPAGALIQVFTAPRISYHVNWLQGLPPGQDYIVTPNGQACVDPRQVIGRMEYAHPAYTPASRPAATPARAGNVPDHHPFREPDGAEKPWSSAAADRP